MLLPRLSHADLDVLFFAPPDDGGGDGGSVSGESGGEGVGGGDGGSGDNTQGGTPNGEGGTPAADPVAEAAAAAVKAELKKVAIRAGIEGDFASADELDAAVTAKRQADARKATDTRVTTKYTDRRSKAEAALRGVKFEAKNDAGEPVTFALSDDHLKPVLEELDGLHGDARVSFEAEIFGELAEVAGDLLPADAHDAFNKAVVDANGKALSIGEWLKQVVEHGAAGSQHVKTLMAEHEAALKKARADGWVEGNKAPQGQASQNGGNTTAGKLTSEQFMAMTPDQRAQAWRERPAEVEALS
jgi:hypothetical protein